MNILFKIARQTRHQYFIHHQTRYRNFSLFSKKFGQEKDEIFDQLLDMNNEEVIQMC
jgi:hypothetical protein